MKSKLTLIAAAIILLTGAATAASSDADDFLNKKIDQWFASAKPASEGAFVTDSKGCLYGIYEGQNGLVAVAMLNNDKTQICRAAK